MNLPQAVEAFLADTCAGKTNETPDAYRRKLAQLAPHFDGRSVGSITPEALEAWRRWLIGRKVKMRGHLRVRGSLSPATVHTTVTAVKTFFRWLSEHGHLRDNPAARLRAPPLPPPQPKAITPKAVDQLLAAAARMGSDHERARNVAIIACLRDTGARVAGLCRARLSDLDLQTGRLWVIEKGKRGRFVYLCAPARKAIGNWLDVRHRYHPQGDALFVNRFGDGLKRGGVAAMLSRLANAAGITERINPHSFRHAFARDTLRAGCDLSRVSQMLGHTRVNVTADYYARWADNELRDDHARFSPGRQLRLPDL